MISACCVRLIDLGTQLGTPSGANSAKRLIAVGWELLDSYRSDHELPTIVYNVYVLEFSLLAPLRRDIEQWFGGALTLGLSQRFDLKSLLGRYGFIEAAQGAPDTLRRWVIHPFTGNADAKRCLRPVTPLEQFMAASPDIELLETLPHELQTLIKASPEFIASQQND